MTNGLTFGGRAAFVALLLATTAGTASAGEGFSTPLFDGESLRGWTIENDCKASVRDGNLLLEAGDGWLRSNHVYADFELHVEWQALQESNYDAGVYVRAAPGGKPFPKRGYQVNLLDGHEGQLIGFEGTNGTEFVKPAGQWNAFDVRCVGDRLTLKVNGKEAYSVTGLEIPAGHVGFQIEVPKGGRFLVRNVKLTELTHDALFDGETLAGWEGAGQPAETCWTVEDGAIVCTGEKGPWLRSAEQYGDFNLRLEYLVSPGGNSGIYVRVPENGNHHRKAESEPPAGFEIQIIDDAAPKYAKLKPYQYTGSIYAIVPASEHVGHPAETWNQLEIDCRGGDVVVTHNGVEIVRAAAADHPHLALRQKKGHLGLQNHSSIVRFRRLRLGPSLLQPESE